MLGKAKIYVDRTVDAARLEAYATEKRQSIMATKRKFKSEAVQDLYQELVGDDTMAREEFEEGLVNIEAAQLIYDMRSKAGLSQRELARKVGTSASAINRLESTDYEGHTIGMVRRIATALSRRLELRAVPIKTPTKARSLAKVPR